MAFEIEHDWQGDLAVPRARIGERVKTRLLVVLCVFWVYFGLIGHQPWRSYESDSISIVKSMSQGASLFAPVAVGQQDILHPPLYYLVALISAKILSPILEMHDGARFSNAIWMTITLMLVGMLGRELWGYGAGRQTNLVFVGSIGLVMTAHMLTPQVAGLSGLAMAVYALALSDRRPYRAAALLACGLAIAFLAVGLIPSMMILLTTLALPLLFMQWRTRRFFTVSSLGILCGLLPALLWLTITWFKFPNLLVAWLGTQWQLLASYHHAYFVKTLAWYALPGLPVALWGIWHARNYLLQKPKYQLLLVFFAISFALVGLDHSPKDIDALPLLIPIAALAGANIETLKRGAAGLLNWFGIMLFGAIGAILWLGWTAMVIDWPAKLQERIVILSGSTDSSIHWLALIIGLLATLTWLMVINNYRHSNRAAITDWAVGMTMVWTLVMTLWHPWIDSARSYKTVMTTIATNMPKHFQCLGSRNLGEGQHALLDYYTDIKAQPEELYPDKKCDVLLIQDVRGKDKSNKAGIGTDWKLLWEGKRAAYTRESFRLYQRK